MKWLANLRISQKLMFGFLLLAVLGLLIGVIGVVNLSSVVSDDQILLARETAGAITVSIYVLSCITIVMLAAAVYLGVSITRLIAYPADKAAKALSLLAVGDFNTNKVLTEQDKDLRLRTDEIGAIFNGLKDLIPGTRALVQAAEKIADGDLTVDVQVRSKEDLLGLSLAELVSKLRDLISSIVDTSEQVAVGANLVSDSSTALSQGATDQASAIEELTASLQQISSQTELNVKNAEKASERAETAKTNAKTGNSQMLEMLRAMEQINASSGDINKIIKVIEDIAFQTNILALNAAVEAARAGQHGKGFAVVAEEVRTLAAKSAAAARETTALIEDSIKNIGYGSKIANETADSLAKIVVEVENSASLANTIVISSQEQAYGLSQINQTIFQVSHVVQTNAATAEESAAASIELSTQAELLVEHAKAFKLKNRQSNKQSLNLAKLR